MQKTTVPLGPNTESAHVKLLEDEQKQTDGTQECVLAWREGEWAPYKTVLISVAVELRLSATLAVHRLVEHKWENLPSVLENTENEAEKLNAEESRENHMREEPTKTSLNSAHPHLQPMTHTCIGQTKKSVKDKVSELRPRR